MKAIREFKNHMIEITDSPDTKQWSEFVYNHEHGNIFQTPELAEVYKLNEQSYFNGR